MTIIDSPQKIPSVNRLLQDPDSLSFIESHGVLLVSSCIKSVLSEARIQILSGDKVSYSSILRNLSKEILLAAQPSLRPVINLTGTVLHTNLGRAALPDTAINAIANVARGASNLEFDLETGKRGDRYKHTEDLICKLTGAESALVVNNNAAAVLLTLNSLAKRKEVPVSRGELIEIGGAFRMPDIMSQAGCKLVEVGTTNRTHASDFKLVIGPRTALLMKVHSSNFQIKGFTSEVPEKMLAKLAHRNNLPFITDLGSGNLLDLESYQLPHEGTVAQALKNGADLVTFSGDKLLGGPQAGIIAGRIDLIEKLKHSPLLRALRPDKITLAALEAVLVLYMNPARLAIELPTLRWLCRDVAEIEKLAVSLLATMQKHCRGFEVIIAATLSQVGSGALPIDNLDSVAFKITVPDQRRSGKALKMLAKAFRDLPVPVIGRITKDALWFDLRCLEDQDSFKTNLGSLKIL